MIDIGEEDTLILDQVPVIAIAVEVEKELVEVVAKTIEEEIMTDMVEIEKESDNVLLATTD